MRKYDFLMNRAAMIVVTSQMTRKLLAANQLRLAHLRSKLCKHRKNRMNRDYRPSQSPQVSLLTLTVKAEPIAQSEQIVVEAEVVTPMKPVEFAPMPLIKSGASVHYDMMEGWRPQQELISGAPIPLYYDYEEFSIPINPLTNKPYVPLYYGPRRDNSLDVHKAFAAKPNGQSSFLPKLYDCGPERG
jgi:hypothetical protein